MTYHFKLRTKQRHVSVNIKNLEDKKLVNGEYIIKVKGGYVCGVVEEKGQKLTLKTAIDCPERAKKIALRDLAHLIDDKAPRSHEVRGKSGLSEEEKLEIRQKKKAEKKAAEEARVAAIRAEILGEEAITVDITMDSYLDKLEANLY